MTRCRQTDALLDAAFAGLDLTRPQADHPATCAECAHALAQLRRFDGELDRIGHELAPEPLLPTVDLAAVSPAAEARPVVVTRRGLLAVTVGVLAIGVMLGGGQWLSEAVGVPFRGAGSIGTADLDAWLVRVFPEVVDETGRPADPSDWQPVHVERCGRGAIAFWAEEGGGVRAYRWAIGDPMNRITPLRTAGLAGSVSDPVVAQMRTDIPVCEVVQDLTPTRAEALAALDAARERWERQTHGRFMAQPIPEAEELSRSTVMDVSAGTSGAYWILLERPDGAGMDRIAVGQDGSGPRLESGSVDGARPDPLGVYVDPGPGSGIFYGRIGDRAAAAIELIGPGRTLRYPVTAPGFILDIPIDPEELTEYRLLDAQGESVSAGVIHRGCGLGAGGDLFQMGRGAVFCLSSDR